MSGNSTEIVKRELEKMEKSVKILMFTSIGVEGIRDCPACQDTASFLHELADLSNGKIELQEYSIKDDKDACKQYFVERAPTILFPDYGIRYTGAPIGIEATPFFEAILIASSGKTGIPADMSSQLKEQAAGKIMRTIVTPTCPICPSVVSIANRIAIGSDGAVTSEIIESYEHGDLAARYNVTGVPALVIGKVNEGVVYDDEVAFLGLISGRDVVEKLIGQTRVADSMYL